MIYKANETGKFKKSEHSTQILRTAENETQNRKKKDSH